MIGDESAKFNSKLRSLDELVEFFKFLEVGEACD